MTFQARVIAVFGRDLLVRDAEGAQLRARVFGRRLSAVCGDEVRCEKDARHGQVHVVEVLPRRTALYRANARGEPEPVVANISQLLVVLAPLPVPDFYMLDRYISAAESTGIAATLVLNKSELEVDEELRTELDAYARIGYRTLSCSARTGAGIEDLEAACIGSVSVLVGQSGVGKSSLVHRLLPEAEVAIGELTRDAEGRHSTTTARAFELPRGGQLIDSPGVRDYAPAIEQLDERNLGFVEIAQRAPNCRFHDCRHLREPGCAVREAAEAGEIHARRYESYRRLRRLREQLAESRGPGWKPKPLR
ncbi:MAG TPA: ribosome small subunit-dependent GTPase A [Steroidobacteraceae bacterium]